MYLIIDHYDSFVYNLKAYFEVLNSSVQVVQSDMATPDYIEQIENLAGIIFSPGPKHPEDCEHSAALLRAFCKRIPILGIRFFMLSAPLAAVLTRAKTVSSGTSQVFFTSSIFYQP